MIRPNAYALWIVLAIGCASFAIAQDATVITEDMYIEHTSTVPANEGELVQLFARRYHNGDANRGAVVALSSGTLPADAGMGLDHENHNFFRHLARQGFDVFAADLTGYGFSPRPEMDDPCNVDPETQATFLVPNPLDETCEPSYPYQLTSYVTDWDETDTIVEYVRGVTGDDLVTLIGWSLSGPRAGGYALRHPGKVERLVIIAPTYTRDAPTEVPTEHPEGYPIRLGNINGLINFWHNMVQCEDWYDEGLSEALRRKVQEFDPLAAEWGTPPGSLYRAPETVGGRSNRPGWNQEVVQQLRTPTLVIHGLDDTFSGVDAVGFYEDLAIDDKIRVDFECGTHWVVWEHTHEAVRDVIAEFLQSGSVNGQSSGVLLVNRDGEFETAE